ncbi:MAG: DUF4342 domain-containing protein [Actinobacteria bacterium]|nr:MAG: DUF4342 domain-containing protein [Actinomycetota bacterium]
MADEKKNTEEFEVSGENVIKKIKELIHEGNVRKISLQNEEGKTLIEMPLSVGVAGAAAAALLAPVWAAIGAIAALVAKLKVVVERVDKTEE